ncbi:immunoglobulin-like domain-containing protein [Listeria fleischmannii]|uniref:immunoglobulin-like domain-containing protein n=1 Tax=Listeria fleischmannii TaxID=1069827 RepID=UPI00345EFC2D
MFEGDVSYAKVYVDGRELKPGGNFDVNTHEFTYYVGANTVTNINQTVTIVAYDQYYNELNRHDVFLAEHN